MFTAVVTGDATSHILVAYVYTLSVNAERVEGILNLLQCTVSTAMQMRTAVYYQYFHNLFIYRVWVKVTPSSVTERQQGADSITGIFPST